MNYGVCASLLKPRMTGATSGDSGASTQGGNGARCTMAKIGGKCCDDNDALARVYNNLLLHEYIYYFTPVHF